MRRLIFVLLLLPTIVHALQCLQSDKTLTDKPSTNSVDCSKGFCEISLTLNAKGLVDAITQTCGAVHSIDSLNVVEEGKQYTMKQRTPHQHVFRCYADKCNHIGDQSEMIKLQLSDVASKFKDVVVPSRKPRAVASGDAKGADSQQNKAKRKGSKSKSHFYSDTTILLVLGVGSLTGQLLVWPCAVAVFRCIDNRNSRSHKNRMASSAARKLENKRLSEMLNKERSGGTGSEMKEAQTSKQGDSKMNKADEPFDEQKRFAELMAGKGMDHIVQVQTAIDEGSKQKSVEKPASSMEGSKSNTPSGTPSGQKTPSQLK